jgi:hypothetical protein
MRIRFNYIFFFLIFLSLFGLGNDQSISRTSVKYLKETEWIANPNSNSKVSKCIHFHFVSFAVFSNLTSQLWEKEFRNSYDRKLLVHFLLQTRVFRNIDIINLISSKRYIPRLFTDDHHVSYRRAELIKQFCSASGIHHQVRNFMWKHLLNRKWINQKRRSNVKERDDLNGCLSGFL